MRRYENTVTINQHVEISDYVDIDVDLADVIGEISDDDLIRELSRRKINTKSNLKGSNNLTIESICDLFGVNYHTKKSTLKELMNKYINEL